MPGRALPAQKQSPSAVIASRAVAGCGATRQSAERAAERSKLVGSGDRSERIRTYNFPQGRVTDHRINLTLYQLDDIIGGGLQAVVEPLVHEHQTELLASLNE